MAASDVVKYCCWTPTRLSRRKLHTKWDGSSKALGMQSTASQEPLHVVISIKTLIGIGLRIRTWGAKGPSS